MRTLKKVGWSWDGNKESDRDAVGHNSIPDSWPAPGSEDTELGVILEPEVVYGTQTLCTRVQA